MIHTTRSHPYVPPKPPAMKHVAFIDLVRDSQWGKDYPVEGKTNPSDNDIIMGLLALIVEELRELKKEINRPKTLR